MLRSTAIRFLLSFTVALIVSCSAAAQQNPGTLATVNGKAITTQDLEQKEVNRLLQAQYQYYQAERKALDDLIVQRLLEEEAQKQGISTDDLLKREVDSKVKDPNEDQLQVYYEGLDSKEPYDQVREKILEHIRDLRRSKLRSAYIETLRAKAPSLSNWRRRWQMWEPRTQPSLKGVQMLPSRWLSLPTTNAPIAKESIRT
jgi:Skp family chaperone for outer membrane proteins